MRERQVDQSLGSKTMEEVLDALNTWFSRAPDAERWGLWDVLSALRGPDLPELGDKATTPGVVRLAALPALQGWHYITMAEAVKDISLQDSQGWGYDHFGAHVFLAARALGIGVKWVEKPKTS